MINAGDSTAVVKVQISDALALAGVAAPTSWSDAHNKLNSVAVQFERDGLTDEMIGSVARARINALFGGPSFAPDGSDLYLDFMTNQAWGRGAPVAGVGAYTSLVRSTSALMLGPDEWQSFASGELARIDGIGAQVAPARTNKCTNWNANPVDLSGVVKSGDAAAVLSVVDDVASLAAAGLAAICFSGKVFKLDNSAGTTAAFATVVGGTGNTNIHSVSGWIRGGTGALGIGGIARPTFAASGAYRKLVVENQTPGSSSGTWGISADAGQVVYFILNQLEEGSFASPPIITTGAAATRAGDLLTADLTGKLAYGVAGFIKVDVKNIGISGEQILAFNDGTLNNRLVLRNFNGPLAVQAFAGGADQGNAQVPLFASGVQIIAFAGGPNFLTMRRAGGAQSPVDTTVTWPTTMTLCGIGGDGFGSTRNLYQHTKSLALFYGSPSKPINQAFFDEVYAKAMAA